MSGDYSRARFDPRADFAAVLMQQGRVQLDADWNELVEILDRRLRAETMDLVSPGLDPNVAGVAMVPRLTPDGFKVQATGGVLTIGRGRMYVDGLLAENHGAGPAEFDPLLAESRGTQALPFDKQPYDPLPRPAPTGGPHLAYLDVWEREVTALERPDLVEPAVGVDTTTRLQTVWQVRLLSNVGAITCSTPDAQIPGWLAVIRPSAGRLSSKAVGVKPADDPCELPPSGGYRGLENQLYRVEIHDGGAIGAATFKWSRDNAAVASAVAEVVTAHELRLASLGRDDVLRFNTGDWVEILDDRRELSGEGGAPDRRRGVIRKVTVDDAKGTISFTPDLPADLIPSGTGDDTVERRHLRVRRWDQRGKIRDATDNEVVDLDATGSSGVIPVPAAGTAVVLEHGVQVSFSLAAAGGTLHAGDYWVFAARTSDASVEELVDAPPRGVHHHFARLAVVTLPGSATDCRTLWPPESGGQGCDCSVCVTPQSHASGAMTIQKAIDQVKETGGTVCLGAGIYTVERALVLEGAQSVRIRGQGWRTMLVGAGGLVDVRSCAGLTIEDLALIAMRGAADPAVALANSLQVRLSRLTLLAYTSADLVAPAIGLGGTLIGVDVRDCTIVAPFGIGRGATAESKLTYVATLGVRIQDNTLLTSRRAVTFDGLSLHLGETRLTGNGLLGCTDWGMTLTGVAVAGSRVDISDNTLLIGGDGLVSALDGAHITGNEIDPLGAAQSQDGIVLSPGLDSAGLAAAEVVGNRIGRVRGLGIAVRTRVGTLMVTRNVIDGAGGGIVFEGRGTSEHVAIADNELLGIGATTNDVAGSPTAVRVTAAQRVDVTGNRIRGVGLAAVQGLTRAGVQVVACANVRVAGNEIVDVGPSADFVNLAAGIDVRRPFSQVEAIDNSVRRESTPAAPRTQSAWVAIVTEGVDEAAVRRAAPRVAVVALDATTHLALTGGWAYAAVVAPEAVAVRGNRVDGRSTAPLMVVGTTGDCALSDNHCRQVGGTNSTAIIVMAGTAVVMGNRVVDVEAAMRLDVDPARVTVIGNITRGGIAVQGGGLDQNPAHPWTALNIRV